MSSNDEQQILTGVTSEKGGKAGDWGGVQGGASSLSGMFHLSLKQTKHESNENMVMHVGLDKTEWWVHQCSQYYSLYFSAILGNNYRFFRKEKDSEKNCLSTYQQQSVM